MSRAGVPGLKVDEETFAVGTGIPLLNILIASTAAVTVLFGLGLS